MSRGRIEENQGPFTYRPDELQCHACGEEFTLAPGRDEPTDYCDGCAQLLLPLLLDALKELRAEVSAGYNPETGVEELKVHHDPVVKADEAISKTKAGIS